MSNNQLSADVQERIKADAEAYVAKTRGQQGRVETYIAGATAVEERAQKLVDALHGLLEWHNTALGYGLGRRIEAAQEALEQWKGTGKEVGRPEHNVSIGEWITYCKNCGFPIAPINECNCIDKETLS